MSTPDKPSYQQRIGYQAGLLGLFALLASSILLISYVATFDSIEKRLQEDIQETLARVIPAEIHDNNMSRDFVTLKPPTLISNDAPVDIFLARTGDEVVAVAYQVTAPDGYAGPIVIMMGVNINGEILGVRVVSHTETPGLGDKIEFAKDDWILGFNGLSLRNTKKNDWKVKKDGGKFDHFSGATITPRAVVQAVRRGMDFFDQSISEILKQSVKSRIIE